MFWFNKNNPDVVFMDNRKFCDTLCDGRNFEVNPDVVADFRNIPYPDNSFSLVVFDPPHLIKVGEKSWLAKKYGRLHPDTYKEDLKQGFTECFRILKSNGILVFKWNETDVKTNEIIELSPTPPLFGHKGWYL
ncbi:MAG: methyltransferase domain-containing protein [Oscillospiraceae bacterium]|nr:methyltransferase domain-containing protein [Oscillospiraceae bacterium]